MSDRRERPDPGADTDGTDGTDGGDDATAVEGTGASRAPSASVVEVLTGADDLAALVRESAGVVVGLDFDGTLAPVVDDHGRATLAPGTRPLLRRLAARPGVLLAVVSGRGIADLRTRVGVADGGVVHVGNHGLELGYDGETVVHPVAAERRAAVDRLCDTLADRLTDVPGTAVENKGITATVHFRTAHATAVPEVIRTVEAAVGEVDGLRVTAGDCIREIRPTVAWDKGDAMRLVGEVVPEDWVSVYVGDDVTDEDAFAAVQPAGAGVHVARDGSAVAPEETVATHRLEGQASVLRLLEWLDEVAPRPSERVDWEDLGPLAEPFDSVGR